MLLLNLHVNLEDHTGAGYELVNHTKKEKISYLHLGTFKKRELASIPTAPAITTWYLLGNLWQDQSVPVYITINTVVRISSMLLMTSTKVRPGSILRYQRTLLKISLFGYFINPLSGRWNEKLRKLLC